jgi:hypothetical protein
MQWRHRIRSCKHPACSIAPQPITLLGRNELSIQYRFISTEWGVLSLKSLNTRLYRPHIRARYYEEEPIFRHKETNPVPYELQPQPSIYRDWAVEVPSKMQGVENSCCVLYCLGYVGLVSEYPETSTSGSRSRYWMDNGGKLFLQEPVYILRAASKLFSPQILFCVACSFTAVLGAARPSWSRKLKDGL